MRPLHRVLVDDRRAYSRLTLAVTCADARVVTVEGLGAEDLHPLQDAFVGRDTNPPDFTDGDPLDSTWDHATRTAGGPLAARSVLDCMLFAIGRPRDCFIRSFHFEQMQAGVRPDQHHPCGRLRHACPR